MKTSPRTLRPSTVLIALLLAPIAACTSGDRSGQVDESFSVAYVDEESEFPRIRYADGLVSVNDRCPVRQRKLNTKLPPIYVNGLPVGFC